MKKYIVLFILLFSINIWGQNTVSLTSASASPGDTLTIEVAVNNSDSFVAFQTDIQLPDQLKYVPESVNLTDRALDHSISATVLENNLLRIVAFSTTQKAFTGSSGAMITYKVVIGNSPGNYTMSMIDPIISNEASANILTGYTNGEITILTGDISTSVSSITFDDTPLLKSNEKSITISNNGTTALNISRIYSDNSYFEIVGDTAFAIQAYGSRSVTIRFNSVIKGTYDNKLLIISDDPDERITEVELNAVAFAVNELHMQSASGRSGHNIALSFSINNMEPFVGFQFDLDLPSVLSYNQDSLWLSSRANNHSVTANMINDQKLRVVVFSDNNTAFTGTDGDVLTIGFTLNGNGGNYSVNLENVIITDKNADNIISDYSSSYVNIVSPDITGNTDVLFNKISVLDTAEQNYTIHNYGNDTLFVNQIYSETDNFWNETSLPQVIPAGGEKSFLLKFANTEKGDYSDKFYIRSNDPDEDPFNFKVSASTYAPNYIKLKDISAGIGDTVTLEIEIENYEDFVAFQFDLRLPDSISYIPNTIKLSDRGQNHQIEAGPVPGRSDNNVIRIIAFSLDQKKFLGNKGAVAYLDLKVGNQLGSFNTAIENGVLSNSRSENILEGVSNGSIAVIDPSPVLTALPKLNLTEDEAYVFPLSDWFGYVNDPNTDIADLVWEFSEMELVSVVVENDSVKVSAASNWSGLDTIKVTVSDGKYSSSVNWLVSYSSVNDAPIVKTKIPDKIYQEDSGMQTIVSDLSAIFTDVDTPELSYSTLVLGSGITSTIEGKSLKVTTVPDSNGVYSVIVTASDGEYSVRDTFKVEIKPMNDPPILANIPDVEFIVGNSTIIELNKYVTDIDNDTTELAFSYSIIGNKGHVSIDESNNRAEISADSVTLFKVIFSVVDDSLVGDSDTINVSSLSALEEQIIGLSGNWNMMSVPLQAANMSKDSLFTDAISEVFGFNKSYIVTDTLKLGVGYWIKYPNSAEIAVKGYKTADTYIPVKSGWNMIGVFDEKIEVASITSEPAGIISSQFFKFSRSYESVDTLYPGEGYWIKCSEAGVLNWNLEQPLAKNTAAVKMHQNPESYLVVMDADNNKLNLYLDGDNSNLINYELPPLPPNGIPDVRFMSGNYFESLNEEQFEILLQSLVYPVSIKLVGDCTLQINDNYTGKIVNGRLDKTNELVISNSSIQNIRVKPIEIPNEYQLFQNYPNPFNPVTTIKFNLPVDSKVRLEVFNVLGQRVEVLIDKEIQAGINKVEFNAKEYGSGIYIYSLWTDKFSDVKKMLILK